MVQEAQLDKLWVNRNHSCICQILQALLFFIADVDYPHLTFFADVFKVWLADLF